MLTLLQRFENMGRKGAIPALGTAFLLLIVCVVSAYVGWVNSTGDSGWMVLGPNFLAICAGAGVMVFAMVGFQLLTRNTYASAEELFPSMARADFVQAIHEEPRPLCVCTRCHIHLPAQFSTGSCPRCNSSVEYYEIDSNDDAEMAIAAVR